MLPYQQIVTLTSNNSVNTAVAVAWRVNSLFDPYYPVLATPQPRFFDTLSALYNNYRVWKTTWKVKASRPFGAAAIGGIYWGANTAIDTNVAAGYGGANGAILDDLKTRPLTQVRKYPVVDTHGDEVLSGTLIMPNAFGVSKDVYAGDPNYAAQVTTDPVRAAFVEAFIISEPATVSQSLIFDVELMYHAELWSFKMPARST